MPNIDFTPYLKRYRTGEWRAPIFRDAILHDAKMLPHKPTMLDIGCGQGFDTLHDIQTALADASKVYIGVEPDTSIILGDIFTETHHYFFEDAPIEAGSVDIAFSFMVLEHLEHPERFWEKIYEVLRPGGIFWSFTMDGRHYFPTISLFLERIGAKDMYLNALHGKRGEDRYENYPTFYRSNTPKQIQQLAHKFSQCQTWTFGRVGQLDYYYPKGLQWIGRTVDRMTLGMGMPGSVIVMRVVK